MKTAVQGLHLDVHLLSDLGALIPVLQGQGTTQLHLLNLPIGRLIGFHSSGPVSSELRQGRSLPTYTPGTAVMVIACCCIWKCVLAATAEKKEVRASRGWRQGPLVVALL